MRPQSRPFVVEIKKPRRGPAASAPETQADGALPSGWAQGPFPAPAVSPESAARRAAEALFGGLRRSDAEIAARASAAAEKLATEKAALERALLPDAAAALPAAPVAATEPEPPRKGRVLIALEPQPVAPAPVVEASTPPERVRLAPRRVAPEEQPATFEAAPKPDKRPLKAAAKVAAEDGVKRAPVAFEVPVKPAAAVEPAARHAEPVGQMALDEPGARTAPRRPSRDQRLRLGEKWKRRLPAVCR